jgi:hypothetical protein
MSRRKIIIFLLILFVILPLISFGLYLIFGSNRSQVTGREEVYVDKDSGETVSTFEGINPETEGNTEVLLLGITRLNEDLLKPHYSFVKEHLNIYARTRLDNKYDTLTLLSQGYTMKNETITGLFRLGKGGNKTVPVSITASDTTGAVRLIIDDPNNEFGGRYDSGTEIFGAD